MSLFEKISNEKTLALAWRTVEENSGGPGGDRVTLGQYEIGIESRLLRLHRALVEGSYRPGPVRVVDIPKKSGRGIRYLAIPCVEDRIVQTAICKILGPLLDREMEDESFAYRPGRSVAMAVARVDFLRREGFDWVVDGDIHCFFDNVPHDLLIRRLEQSVDDDMVISLIEQWLESFTDGGEGLPQGSPLSPLLSNLYMDQIDEKIRSRNIRLVRYADDFLLLTKTASRAAEAKEKMARLLERYGLEMSVEKSRIVPFDKGIRFLGHLFVRGMVMKEVHQDDGRLPPNSPAIVGEAVHSAPEFLRGGEPETVLPDHSRKDLSPGIRVLYITRRGRKLDRRNKCFSILEDGEEILALPVGRVDRIEVSPGVQVYDQAIRLCFETDTVLHYVNGHGLTEGMLSSPNLAHGRLHLAQARYSLDPDLRIALARRIVSGRLKNQRAQLKRLNRRRNILSVSEKARKIGRLVKKLDQQPDIAGLMGVEGQAAALYWPEYGRCLRQAYQFERRQRHPPPDRANLMLNILASFLTRDIVVLAYRHHLHSGIGVLHQTTDGHETLAYDLIEEFRAPVIEALTAFMINNEMINSDDFYQHKDRGLRIGNDGYGKLVRSYERWLDRDIKSPRYGHKVKWRRLIEEQILAYRHHILDGVEAVPYQPYIMDY